MNQSFKAKRKITNEDGRVIAEFDRGARLIGFCLADYSNIR